jgi:hypothetical protein
MELDKRADDVIFLSNGFYRFNGKCKQSVVLAMIERRRQRDSTSRHKGGGEDGQLYILVEPTRATHIKSGIRYNRLTDVGKIERYENHITLNSDRKRFWLDDVKSLNDKTHCNSLPVNASLVADKIAKGNIEWKDEKEVNYE